MGDDNEKSDFLAEFSLFTTQSVAAGLGFEPRHTAPKTVVLPLDDPATG
jgi:hypothetical protein